MSQVRRRLRGLHLRFLAVVIAGATLFALIAGAAAYRHAHRLAIANARATVNGLSDAVAATAAIGAFAGDRELMQEVVDGLGTQALIATVEVVSPTGEVLVRHERGLSEGGPAPAATMTVDNALRSPFDSEETIARLHIGVDATRVEAAARDEALTLALLMAGQTALVSVLLYLVAKRFVSKPIVRLGRELWAMKPGTSDRLKTPQRHARDEIGLLIRGANQLLRNNEYTLNRERKLRASMSRMEAQYRQIFDSTSAGIFVLGAGGRLINSNPTVLKVIGLPLEAMTQLQGDDFVAQVFARPDRVRELMREASSLGETVSTDLELLQRGASPRWVHCLLSVQGEAGKPPLIEGVMYDITERRLAEGAVRHQAEHDGLTDLKNRQATEAAIDRFIAEAFANDSKLTLLYIDLDGFKQINDALGHKAGDEVLLACAQRLNAATRRASDVVGRLGGDEFMIALNNVGPGDPLCSRVADQVLRALCEPIELDDGRRVTIGASIGMACFPRHGITRKQLLHAADSAMYEVKRAGKNAFAMANAAAKIY